MEIQWRYCWLMFAASFLVSWYTFACLYAIEPWVRGDFRVSRDEASNVTLCVASAVRLIDMIMFSMETQASIGYGAR
jgi:hypothetical protein